MEEVLRELTETELASVAGGSTFTINNQDSNQGVQGQFGISNADSNQGVQGFNFTGFSFPPVTP